MLGPEGVPRALTSWRVRIGNKACRNPSLFDFLKVLALQFSAISFFLPVLQFKPSALLVGLLNLFTVNPDGCAQLFSIERDDLVGIGLRKDVRLKNGAGLVALNFPNRGPHPVNL